MPGSKRRALKKLLSPSSSPHGNSSHPTPPNGGAALTPETSNTSIGSDPGNYMSDEALQQDLAVEEMMDRERSIGSGMHRMSDGVGDLGASPNGSSAHASPHHRRPPPPPPTHERRTPPPPPPQQAHQAPPPPQAPSGMDMNGPPPQQMTAEALMFGSESGGGKKKSSKQRFAERQARKQEALIHSAPPSDPDWTAQLERERQEEIKVITDACTTLGRTLHEIAPDGHCMFNAIADQLACIGLLPPKEAEHPWHTRKIAAKYMLAHPDDFMPFLPSITGEDSADATEDGMMTEKGFKKYCKNITETGEWGGEPEIQALSRAFKVPIHVFQRGPPTVVSHGGQEDTFGGASTAEQSAALGDNVVRISYHKRMYGLGEHYNSLRKAI